MLLSPPIGAEMALSYSVEVAVPEGTSTTEIGRVFEKFSRKMLEQDGYDVVETVRIKGAEIDLRARNRSTNEKIWVECKAHRVTAWSTDTPFQKFLNSGRPAGFRARPSSSRLPDRNMHRFLRGTRLFLFVDLRATIRFRRVGRTNRQ